MTPPASFIALLQRFPESFFACMVQLWKARHTGSVLVHFAGGLPKAVEIQQPSERIPLDNRAA